LVKGQTLCPKELDIPLSNAEEQQPKAWWSDSTKIFFGKDVFVPYYIPDTKLII
jgi:hypothetical protein